MGSYTATASSATLGLVLTDTAGAWSAAKAPLPSNASSGYDSVELVSLSCASATSCAGGGSYDNSAYDVLGLLLADNAGTWTATQAPLPSGASSDPEDIVDAVSCPTAASCLAVGSYVDTSSNNQGVLLSESAGSWSATKAPLPSGASGTPAVSLATTSCWSTGHCVAAGGYEDGSGNLQGLLLVDAAGTWSASEAPLPTIVGANPGVEIPQLTCSPSGVCVAAGSYVDSSSQSDALFETHLGSSCSTAVGTSSCTVSTSLAVTGGTLGLRSSPTLYFDVDLDGYDQWASGSASPLSGCTGSGSGTTCSGGSAPALEVIDATGSGSGWAISAYLSSSDLPSRSALDFDGAGASAGTSVNDPLSVSPFGAAAPAMACDHGSDCTLPIAATSCSHSSLGITACPSYPVNLGAGSGATSQVDLYSATSGSGMGAICFASGTATSPGCGGTSGADFYDLAVPADAAAGALASTLITLTISSGP
ncbi:MAG TPA: hypothetical protein VMD59_17070 [Acidimicrobiales bacterium]|nr:hypothetical protein [Acidimicrobiales bacterium]